MTWTAAEVVIIYIIIPIRRVCVYDIRRMIDVCGFEEEAMETLRVYRRDAFLESKRKTKLDFRNV